MAWSIEFAPSARKALRDLDPPVAKRILKFLGERIAPLEDPRCIGEALQGSALGGVLEVPRGRLPDHLRHRGRAAEGAGGAHRQPAGSLPLKALDNPGEVTLKGCLPLSSFSL